MSAKERRIAELRDELAALDRQDAALAAELARVEAGGDPPTGWTIGRTGDPMLDRVAAVRIRAALDRDAAINPEGVEHFRQTMRERYAAELRGVRATDLTTLRLATEDELVRLQAPPARGGRPRKAGIGVTRDAILTTFHAERTRRGRVPTQLEVRKALEASPDFQGDVLPDRTFRDALDREGLQWADRETWPTA